MTRFPSEHMLSASEPRILGVSNSSRFHTLISQLCTEHLECLRSLREELSAGDGGITKSGHAFEFSAGDGGITKNGRMIKRQSLGILSHVTSNGSDPPLSVLPFSRSQPAYQHRESFSVDLSSTCHRASTAETTGTRGSTMLNSSIESQSRSASKQTSAQRGDVSMDDMSDCGASIPTERPCTTGCEWQRQQSDHTERPSGTERVSEELCGSETSTSCFKHSRQRQEVEWPRHTERTVDDLSTERPRHTERTIEDACMSHTWTGLLSNSVKHHPSYAHDCSSSRSCADFGFTLHHAWQEQDYQHRRTEFTTDTPFQLSSSALTTGDEGESSDAWASGFVLHPNQGKRLAWDFVGLTMILYDVIFVPLQAFNFEENAFVVVSDWVTRTVWTLDMPASCFVGFYHEGRLHMGFNKTLKHYMSTWFVVDLALVVTDWMLYFLEKSDGAGADRSRGFVRMLRIARFARMLRLLRLLKLQRMLHTIDDLIHTENFAVYFKCAKPIFGMILLTHILACGWYAIGIISTQRDNWINVSKIKVRTKGYQYATCLHWSLSQFTLSTMDVHAQNISERLYTIAVLLFGISAFSCIVGGFTSAVEQLREIKSDETKQFWLLRRFLKDYEISKKLGARVVRYCDYAYTTLKTRKQESEVLLLQLLTVQLTQELAKEIHTPQLTPHPLFRKLARYQYKCLDKVCSKALVSWNYARGDPIFTKGTPVKGLIIFTDGVGKYGHHGQEGCKTTLRLNQKDWVCEPSLWTRWTTLGNATAVMNTRVIVVDAGWFEVVMCEASSTEWLMAHEYATMFIAYLNSLPREELTDVVFAPDDSEFGCRPSGATADTGIVGAMLRRFSYHSNICKTRVSRASRTSSASAASYVFPSHCHDPENASRDSDIECHFQVGSPNFQLGSSRNT